MNISPEDPPTDIVNSQTSNSNRVIKLKNVTKAAGSKLKHTFKAMSLTAGLVPHLGSALDDMSELVGILEDVVKDEDDLDKLFAELQNRSDNLQICITKFVGLEGGNNTTTLITNSINKHLQYVKECREKGHLRGNDAVKRAHTIEALLKQLHSDIELKAWENIAVQFAETQLARLCPVSEATYNSSYARIIQRGSCTRGTRQDLLTMLQDWARPTSIQPIQPQPGVLLVTNQNTAKVFWMSGMAGTGKTTVAYSLCEWLEDNAQLGASFFCSRTSSSCQNIDKIIPTIAYQLGRFSPAYQSSLCKSLQETPDLVTRDIQVQFEKLIVTPLQAVKTRIPDGTIIVVDALDECADDYGAEMILDLLLIHAGNLPVRFFITSRPEPCIRAKMLPVSRPLSSVFHLHDIDPSIVNEDIKKYLADALKHLTPRPTNNQILQLASQAGSLFIYASTLVRYISPRGVRAHSRFRLHKILETNMRPLQADENQPGGFYKELDQLYRTVLELAFADALEDQELDIIRGVLQTVVCAQEPVAIGTLSGILGFPEEDILYSLDSLHSVIHVPEGGGRISTLHASFSDFLFSQSRAGPKHHCNKAQRNQILAQSCFNIMKQQLRFNICSLESSFTPDSEVLDLKERIRHSISPELFYACRFWGNHLRETCLPISECFYGALRDFFSARLLFWMEVLNLNICIRIGVQMLSQLQFWMLRNNRWPDIQVELSDARRLLLQFAANSCSISTPHIYISALPLCTGFGSVYNNYSKCIRGLITGDAEPITTEKEHTELVHLQGTAMIHSVALSPDGSRMVSGSSNGAIQIWDVYNCTKIGQPLIGHSRSVLSVAISPDGAYVISGSSDKTIRVWNACDGTPHGKPLEGHTASVNSVAVSYTKPTILASGSSDKTIRLWDLHSSNPLGSCLKGHTGPVNSVAFSSTCKKLVSGSFDKTIRIWDPLSGTLLGQPIIGHLESVNSVAFSSDGTRIVSGSHDRTIRVWDTESGTLLGQPLTGHTGWVKSVAFAPDCSRIVSGSFDQTIRTWNVQTGKQIGKPFEGHIGWVSSASFTPDGTHVISSSSDQSIRLWHTQTDTSNDWPLEKFSNPSLNHTMGRGTESDLWDIQRDKKFDLDSPMRLCESLYLNPLVETNDDDPYEVEHEAEPEPMLAREMKPTHPDRDSRRVTVNKDTIVVWQHSNYRCATIVATKGCFREIVSVAFSSSCIRIVVGMDRALKTVQMWEVGVAMHDFDETMEQRRSRAHRSPEDKRVILGPIILASNGWLTFRDNSLEGTYQFRRTIDKSQERTVDTGEWSLWFDKILKISTSVKDSFFQ